MSFLQNLLSEAMNGDSDVSSSLLSPEITLDSFQDVREGVRVSLGEEFVEPFAEWLSGVSKPDPGSDLVKYMKTRTDLIARLCLASLEKEDVQH